MIEDKNFPEDKRREISKVAYSLKKNTQETLRDYIYDLELRLEKAEVMASKLLEICYYTSLTDNIRWNAFLDKWENNGGEE